LFKYFPNSCVETNIWRHAAEIDPCVETNIWRHAAEIDPTIGAL